VVVLINQPRTAPGALLEVANTFHYRKHVRLVEIKCGSCTKSSYLAYPLSYAKLDREPQDEPRVEGCRDLRACSKTLDLSIGLYL